MQRVVITGTFELLMVCVILTHFFIRSLMFPFLQNERIWILMRHRLHKNQNQTWLSITLNLIQEGCSRALVLTTFVPNEWKLIHSKSNKVEIQVKTESKWKRQVKSFLRPLTYLFIILVWCSGHSNTFCFKIILQYYSSWSKSKCTVKWTGKHLSVGFWQA